MAFMGVCSLRPDQIRQCPPRLCDLSEAGVRTTNPPLALHLQRLKLAFPLRFRFKRYMSLLQDLQQYHPQVGLAMASTVLVIYGNDINRFLRKHIRSWSFVCRLLFFISLCAFGYGLAVVYSSRLLSRFLGSLNPWEFAGVTLGGFLLLGILAERKKQM